MKLEVGQFVRTKKYGIHKISEIDERKSVYKYICDYRPHEDGDGTYTYSIYADKDIVKASHNIKELLQVGDIISYEFPTGVGMVGYENVTILPELLNTLQNGENNHEYHIKTIVTKEQMEAMQYKVME